MKQIFYFELPLHEGYTILSRPKEGRLYRGQLVSACSGWLLFQSLQGKPICCWRCGLEASRWIADGSKNAANRQPVLNLYCTSKSGSSVTMMTRDHIIPSSLGGKNDVENLRPGCENCNSRRGNKIDAEEIAFGLANPHLMNMRKFKKGMEKAQAYKSTRSKAQVPDSYQKMLEHMASADAARLIALVDK